MVSHALSDKAFRKKVSEAGYHRVMSEHTYVHRLQELLQVMKRNYS